MNRCLAAIAVLVFLGALALTTSRAQAQQGEVRHITPTEATGDCIGDPKTPLCAVETFMACDARADMSLCKGVGVSRFTMVCPEAVEEYRIISEETLGQFEPPPSLKGVKWELPDFVKFIVHRRILDAPRHACIDQRWSKYYYWVGKTEGRWRIVTWTSEHDSI